MTRAIKISLAPLALAGLLAAAPAFAPAGPGLGVAEAACKGADRGAYKNAPRKARKTTLCLINKQRSRRGLPRLKEQRHQRKAAKKHTRQMLRKDCFAHRCPGEGDLVDRISATSYLPCGCFWGVAENIAYGYRARSRPKAIVGAWMDSPPHRQNILNRRYEHVGIGIRRGTPSGGGKGATYTTTFGYRD